MKTLCRILIYVVSFFSAHSFGQTLTSSNATNEGGALQLINPLKTANNIANNWTLYNMTGPYGNSLQFWNYGNGGFYGSRFTILDNGRVGIGTSTPIAQLSVNGDGHFKVADDRSGIGALTIETNNGTNLKLGGNTTYSWIQSHNSKPLYINELGNNTIFNLVGGNVGIGTTNPRANLDMAKDISNGQLGTVFGRLPEGDATGLGTYLGVKGYTTQGVDFNNIKSFSIVHDFYGQTNSSINFLRGGSVLGGFITFNTFDNTEKMRIAGNGNVGIGTTNPTSKLTVAGNINSREVKVSVDAGADFVFEKDYALPSLQEVEKFVTENKHLPEIASAKEMQKEGINLSEMNIKLLQKIEEQTLYLIELSKEVNKLKSRISELEKK
nr:tail fiber protein [uncultured Flavobacterium sp.]